MIKCYQNILPTALFIAKSSNKCTNFLLYIFVVQFFIIGINQGVFYYKQ